MHQSSHRNLLTLLCLPAILIGLAAPMDASEPRSAVALQELVNSLKAQLGIDAVVSAAIVTTNTLLVSVQPVDGDPGTFRMAFEERFLTALDAGRPEGDYRPRARSCLDLHAPPISADRASCQHGGDACRAARKPRTGLQQGVGTRRHQGRPRALPRAPVDTAVTPRRPSGPRRTG